MKVVKGKLRWAVAHKEAMARINEKGQIYGTKHFVCTTAKEQLFAKLGVDSKKEKEKMNEHAVLRNFRCARERRGLAPEVARAMEEETLAAEDNLQTKHP